MRVGGTSTVSNLYHGGAAGGDRGLALARPMRPRDATAASTTHVTGVTIERVVYCTAAISGVDNLLGHQEQDIYLRALRRTQCRSISKWATTCIA